MPLYIIKQDISKFSCDAIVNSTNRYMKASGGIDLAIHKAAGPYLANECNRIAPLEVGFAKITFGYNLKCKYIIHTSGPKWHGGNTGERALLKSCYMECLRLAKDHKCKSIAFPLISSGTCGYPKEQVMAQAVDAISQFLKDNEMDVYICVVDSNNYKFNEDLQKALEDYINGGDIQFGKATYFREKEKRLEYFEESHVIKDCSCCLADRLCDEEDREYRKAVSKQNSFEKSALKQAKNLNGQTLEDFLKNMRDGFSGTLFHFIDKKGITDVECYKKANVDRKVFSKIRSNVNYKPSKQTAVAFAIALELNLDDTLELLASAGLTLSRSSKFDSIVMFYILNRIYDIYQINEALFHFDQMLLGSCMI